MTARASSPAVLLAGALLTLLCASSVGPGGYYLRHPTHFTLAIECSAPYDSMTWQAISARPYACRRRSRRRFRARATSRSPKATLRRAAARPSTQMAPATLTCPPPVGIARRHPVAHSLHSSRRSAQETRVQSALDDKAWRISLASSYGAVQLKRGGFEVRWMIRRSTSARPYPPVPPPRPLLCAVCSPSRRPWRTTWYGLADIARHVSQRTLNVRFVN